MKTTKSYFENHPGVDTLYFTSDGSAFFTQHNAYNHARDIGDREVTTLARAEVIPPSPDSKNKKVFDSLPRP